MKTKLLVFICLLIVGLLSAVVHMPATTLIHWARLPTNVTLHGVSGTLLHGQVDRMTVNSIDLGKVRWQAKPSSLLLGQLGADVRFGEQSTTQIRGKGLIGLSLSTLHLKQFSVLLPVSELSPYISPEIPVEIAGNLSLFLDEYQHDGSGFCRELIGEANWQNTHLSIMSTPLLLGGVSAELSCDQNQLIAQPKQESEQVSSEFNVRLTAPNQYSVSGWLHPNTEFPLEFMPQLTWLIEPDENNRYPIKLSGRW
ncbi:type II secretion system protein N [Vibrio sp. RC27]